MQSRDGVVTCTATTDDDDARFAKGFIAHDIGAISVTICVRNYAFHPFIPPTPIES
jgi:hypothetical protein